MGSRMLVLCVAVEILEGESKFAWACDCLAGKTFHRGAEKA